MLPPSLIEATTLGDLLLRAAARWPEREALVFPHARLTYHELAERACVRAPSSRRGWSRAITSASCRTTCRK